MAKKRTKSIKNTIDLRPVLAVIAGIAAVGGIIFAISKLPDTAPPLKRTDKDSSYLYKAGNNTFEAMFGHKESKTPQVEFSILSENDSKATATFTMLGTNTDTTDPQKKGKELTFEDVMPNVDLRYKTLPNGVKEEIVLKEKVDQDTFQFTLDIENAYPSEITKGFPTPTFYDVDGNYLFHFEEPYAYDSKGEKTYDASLQVRKGGSNQYKILVHVNKEWLDHEDRVYPIYIDPTIVHDTSSEIGNDSLNRATHSGDTGIDPVEITPDDSTLLLLHMDEGSANTCAGGTNDVCDSSTSENDGAFSGTAAHTATAKIGDYALSLDGDSDYVTIADESAFDSLTAITVSAWVKRDTTGTHDVVVGKNDPDGGERQMLLIVNSDNYVRFGYTNTGASITQSPNEGVSITDTNWHHVVGRYDGSTLKTYVDGVENTSVAYSSGGRNGTAEMLVGATTDGNYFDGTIDEVVVYNRALSLEEIKTQHSQRAIHTTYQELKADEHIVGLWHMDEGADNTCSGGEDVCDTSGNGNHGTFTGTATHTTTSRVGSNGVETDGDSDYITISNSSELNPKNITVEMWAKSDESTWSTSGVLASKRNAYILHPSGGASTVTFYIYDGGWYHSGYSASLDITQWHHYAGTYDGKTIRIYIDGELASESVHSGSINTADTGSLYIGKDDGYAAYLDGQMDELRISNIARTQEEIKMSASRRLYSTYTSDVIDMGAAVESWNDISWSENGVNTTDGETLSDSTNLVAHWKFNETSGTTADNAEGTAALDGTLTNMTTSGQDAAAGDGWTSDNKKWGAGALMFDGTDAYIDVGNDSSLNFTSSDFSIESWIRIDDAISGSANYMILNRGTINTDGYTFRINGNATGGSVTFITSQSGAYQQTNSSTWEIQSGKWYHVAVVRDGATAKVYKNGKDVTSTSGTHINPTTTTANAYIGQRGSTDYFKGTMDSTRVYSRVLTGEEILANYNSSNIEFQTRTGRSSDPNDGTWEDWKPNTNETQIEALDELSPIQKISQTNLIAHWRLDETSGTRNDSEGSNNLTDNNTVLYAQGHLKNAADFEASNSEYLSIADNANLSTGDIDFSYTFWVKMEAKTTQYFITKQDSTSVREYNCLYGVGADRISCNFYNSSGTSIGAVTANNLGSPSTDTWYFVYAYHDADTNEVGVSINNGTADTASTTGTISDTAAGFKIGAVNSTPSGFVDGEMDEISFWKRTLTAAERTQLYLGGLDSHTNPTGSVYQEIDTTTYYEGSGAEKVTVGAHQVDGNTEALWHFDETNGDNAGDDVFDETANNYDGEFVGTNIATAVVDGISGKARQFNGTDDYITLDNNAFSTLSEGTIEAWVYLTGSGTQGIILYSYADANNQFIFEVENNKIHWGARPNTGSWQPDGYGSTTTITHNQWHHVAMTIDSGGWDVYLDGVDDGGSTHTGFYDDLVGTYTTYIGGSHSGYGDRKFKGMIDEVRISSVARTPEEIAETYRRGRDHYINKTITSDDLSGDTTLPFYIAADRPGTYLEATVGESAFANYQPDENTVGLWRMDEGADDACDSGNSDACDASGNGNHGNETGTTTPDLQGRVGKARDFDGSSGYVTVTDNTSLNPDYITVSAWIKTSDTSTLTDFISKEQSTPNNGYLFRISSNVLQFYVGNSDTWTNSQTAYTSTDWNYVVGTYDGSNVKLYVNGQLVDSDAKSNPIDDSTSNLIIGNSPTVTTRYYTGLLDEIRIDNTARTANEIRQAYEIGRRTHPITIDFAASLDSGDLIADSSDYYFVVDETGYGATDKAEHIYPGDKIIVRETVDDTEYIAQGTVSSVNKVSGEVSVIGGWDSGATFPSSGYTANASVFKWQKEYFDLSGPLSTNIDAVTNLTLRLTNGHEGRTVWLDDLNSSTGYLSTNTGSTITSATGNRYMQYRTILTSSDTDVSANVSDITIDYVTKEPEGYWKFDEGYGTTAYDHSPNTYNGTLTSSPTWQNEDMCISGKCLEFDGSTNYVTLEDASILDPTTAFSLSGWIKVTDIANSTNYNIIAKQDWTNKLGFRLFLGGYGGCADNNCLGFTVGDGVTRTSTSAAGINLTDTGRWYHVAATFDSGDIKVYLDGSEEYSTTTTVTSVSPAPAQTLTIGRHSNGGEFFPGFIDDLKYYSYERSPDEIRADYNSTVSSVHGASASYGPNNKDFLTDGLIGYWKMDETGADTCTDATNDNCDSSGMGNDGAWNGTATSGSGKFGSGVSLDGNSDYVQIADASSLDISDTISVSMWAYADTLSGWDTFISKFGDGGGGTQGDLYIYSNAGTLGLVLNGPKNNNWTTSVTMDTLTWTHITVTYDGEYIRFYKNGDLEDSLAGTGALSLGTNSNDLYIGYNTPWGEYWDGTIDDVRIYNKVLSPTDVQNLYNWVPGPAAYWDFNDNRAPSLADNSESLYDKSGNGYTGTITGYSGSHMEWVTGKYGSGGNFEDDMLISLGDNFDLSTTDKRTITAWVKPSQIVDNETIIGKQDASSPYTGWGFIQESQKLRFEYINALTTDQLQVLTTNNVLTAADQWYHVATTFDAKTVNFFVNGVQVAVSYDINTLSTDVDSALPLNIAGRDDTNFELYDGVLDEIKIYDYVRTPSQIIEDMNAGHPAPGSPVGSAAGHFQFDEGVDNTCSGGANDACDSSPNGNDASNVGAEWTNDGKFGKALTFTGSDYISIPDDDSLDFGTGDFTISSWIKTSTSAGNKNLFNKGAAGGLSGWRYGILNGVPRILIGDTDGYVENDLGSTSIADGNWHNLIVVFDRDDSAIGYVDGVQIGTLAIDNVEKTVDNGSAVLIGDSYDDFTGTIDEIKFYSLALTESQVKVEYNQGKATVLGAGSTASDGSTADSSAAREYCVPGDTSTCNAPVGEWGMDKNTGTSTTYDTSGNGYNGTLTSITESSWVPGKHGSALEFDGSADYVTVTDNSDIRFDSGSQDFSVELWFKRASDDGDWNYLVDKRDASDDGWRFLITTSDTIRFSIDTIDFATTSTVTDTNWHHVAVTIDRNGNGILYLDGEQNGTPQAISSEAMATTTNMTIAKQSYTSGDVFEGAIDQIALYDYVRTPAQIAWSYNRGEPVGWWQFDECTGTTVYDVTGRGNDGTITIGGSGSNTSAGTCSSGTGTEAWNNGTTGKISNSLDFDGTDDLVEVANDYNPKDVTVMAWFKSSDVTQTQQVFNKYASASNGWGVRISSSIAAIYEDIDGGDDLIYSTSISNDTWYHVTAVMDNLDMKLYINGNLMGSGTDASDGLDSFSGNFYIGVRRDDAAWPFKGQVDEVRLYNYAQTAAQIKEAYTSSAVSFE